MGYVTGSGRWANTVDLVLVGAATRSASFQSNAIELGDRAVAILELDVSSVSGTNATLDAAVETSKSAAGPWRQVAAFAQRNAVAIERKSFSGLDRFVRAVVTLGGTNPVFAISIAGEAK